MQRDEILALLGRLFIAVIFLASAFGKITNFDATVKLMSSKGIPLAPLLCAGAATLETLGAVALILGYHVRWGAGALAAFLIAATAIFHIGPDQRIHLLKNLAILGGLIHIMAFGAGEIAMERR